MDGQKLPWPYNPQFVIPQPPKIQSQWAVTYKVWLRGTPIVIHTTLFMVLGAIVVYAMANVPPPHNHFIIACSQFWQHLEAVFEAIVYMVSCTELKNVKKCSIFYVGSSLEAVLFCFQIPAALCINKYVDEST